MDKYLSKIKKKDKKYPGYLDIYLKNKIKIQYTYNK